MTNKEKILCAKLLNRASDFFANNYCNDLPISWFSDWEPEEIKALMRSFHEYNEGAIQRKLEDFELNKPTYIGDSSYMNLFAHKLTQEANTNLETE